MRWPLSSHYGKHGIHHYGKHDIPKLISQSTEHIMKKTRQNKKTGLGLSHQNPGILSRSVVQAADLHWETAEERHEEPESNLHSSPKARRGMRNKRNKGGGRDYVFQKALSPHLVGKQGGHIS